MDKYTNGHQLLLAFERELQGIHGKGRDYTSPKITVRGTTFCYYFTKKQVALILSSNGSREMDFLDSLYKYEEALENYITNTNEEKPYLNYWEWVQQNDLKIIIKKNDIVHYSKRRN